MFETLLAGRRHECTKTMPLTHSVASKAKEGHSGEAFKQALTWLSYSVLAVMRHQMYRAAHSLPQQTPATMRFEKTPCVCCFQAAMLMASDMRPGIIRLYTPYARSQGSRWFVL